MYLLCVFLVYRRWIAPLPVVGQLRNVGVPWLVGAMAVVYVGVFLLGKALALPAEPFMTKLFADKSIPDVILTLLTIFILAPLNEETLFRGIMLNVFRSRYCWTMWLGALITSLLFVAAHSQYQNLLTLAELFLVGLITSVASIAQNGSRFYCRLFSPAAAPDSSPRHALYRLHGYDECIQDAQDANPAESAYQCYCQ